MDNFNDRSRFRVRGEVLAGLFALFVADTISVGITVDARVAAPVVLIGAVALVISPAPYVV